MTDPVIADAGPLIGLARVELLSLLRDLYGSVLIPPAVFQELRTPEARPGSLVLLQAVEDGWLRVEKIAPGRDFAPLGLLLDPGEIEAIALAESRPYRFILLDEKRGRAVARARGLRVVGIGGVLIAARQKGLIERVADGLDRLAEKGYRLSDGLRARILLLAGE